MSRKRLGVSRLLLFGLVLVATPALAHRLQVFAGGEGDRIAGSVYFAGGNPASGARVRILDAAGQVLAELTPDGQGNFSYQVQSAQDHLVVADTGDGHRAQWRVQAAELSSTLPSGFQAAEPARTSPEAAPGHQVAVSPDLEVLVERAVARQVRPLREELAQSQGHAAFRDLLGGIGYILGIAGLLAWWHVRRPPKP